MTASSALSGTKSSRPTEAFCGEDACCSGSVLTRLRKQAAASLAFCNVPSETEPEVDPDADSGISLSPPGTACGVSKRDFNKRFLHLPCATALLSGPCSFHGEAHSLVKAGKCWGGHMRALRALA
eukprot:scaffold121528_cov18-Tisochrysis_lutea.AAC.1